MSLQRAEMTEDAPTRARRIARTCVLIAPLFAPCAASAQAIPTDPASSSRQAFVELAAVLQSPRCMNCHTRTDYPRQGDDRHRHTMNVARGPVDRGAAGLHCATCHRSVNQAASGVPGAADWHIAPLRMAWEGLSVGELCRALLNPTKGAMQPNQFIPHFGTGLVRWAWSPGVDRRGEARSTPPVSYEHFLQVASEWVANGALCPNP
jgi:hypothetical protein